MGFAVGFFLGADMLSERENYLRAVEFRFPEWIPSTVGFPPIVWHTHRERLEEVALRHPRLFNDYKKGSMDFDAFAPVYRQGEHFRDNWGCLWYNNKAGLEGQVVEHPLADWKAFATYDPPDLDTFTERGQRDWKEIRLELEEKRRQGSIVIGDGERLFDRLYFLRGFENLMIDIATDEPRLQDLIDMLLRYELKLTSKYLSIGVDAMGYHTDIGTQNGLMISPDKFRQYIKPMFKELFTSCRENGTHVLLSSDGNLLEIVDDLVECGVSVHDPQYRANTLDGIERAYKGKMCINLDLDRQMFAFCSPEDIREHVRTVVEALYLPEGGLMLSGSVWDEITPLENIEALCRAMEEFSLYQSE